MLVLQEGPMTESMARKREVELKKWSKEEKERFIECQ